MLPSKPIAPQMLYINRSKMLVAGRASINESGAATTGAQKRSNRHRRRVRGPRDGEQLQTPAAARRPARLSQL